MKTINVYLCGMHSAAAKAITMLVLLTIVSLNAHAQESAGITVSGSVTFAQDKEAAPGVNVYRKGSSVGTYTDAKGAFQFPGSLNVGDILVFSFIGHKTVEYTVNAPVNDLSIALEIDAISMVEEPLVMCEQAGPGFVARVFRRAKK